MFVFKITFLAIDKSIKVLPNPVSAKIPEGFRPITNTQVFGYSQDKLGTIVQRELAPDGNIRYMCINGIAANAYVITPATSWLTNDKYPTNN